MPADQSQTSVPGQGVQGEAQLHNVVGHFGQEVWKCTKRPGGGHVQPPWVQQLRAVMRALWALSPMARQSLPFPEEPGCENSRLNAAEDDKKWRALVGSLHFVESTFDKKEKRHVSRATQS